MMNNKYKDSEINKIIKSMIILVDTREKKWSHIKIYLKSNNIKYLDYKLDFGDYSFMIPQSDKLKIDEDVYFNDDIAIERKANAEEISGNLTEDRDRLKREFERGNNKIRLLIENSSYADIYRNNYNTQLNSNSFIGSLHSLQEEYNSPFFFVDKIYSGHYIVNTFKYYIRNKLKQN